MARYLGPRLRITRRLGHLSGLTRKKPAFKPLNPANPLGPRKIIPPGQHGRNKSFKKKPYESCEYDYLIRLKLKQRLRFHYGLTERQLVRYVQQAKKTKGSTGRVLLCLLEMRLDNIVFKLHMAPTIKAARQLINHGHILVNKKKVTIPSYPCKPNDVITVAPKIRSMELVSRFLTEFDREKSRYERLLNILEYGKRGITIPTKDLYLTKKNVLKTEQKQITESLKNSKIQSLKIGSILNVQVKQQGRYEAEAISYAFGKMIVIHPLFLGKQSTNKKIRVIIYKKSQNNKIIYAYPANAFYLRLENIRQLNSLDVARIFGRYTGRSINRSGSKIYAQKKLSEKKTLSSLILINGAKMLPKTVLNRRQRLNETNKENDSSLINLNQEFSKRELSSQALSSVFVRIIATKCLNTKLRANNLNSTDIQLTVKDPIAYREKFVYTQTSRTLRQFGTRFYAQILKDQSAIKKGLSEQQDAKFLNNKKLGRTDFTDSENRMNSLKMTLLSSQNVNRLNQKEESIPFVTKFRAPKAKSKQDLVSLNIQSTKLLEIPFNEKNELKNNNEIVFKAGRGYPELLDLLSKQNKHFPAGFGRICNIPVIFDQYLLLIAKLANLKQQKKFKNEIYSTLKTKLLTNLVFEAKNQFLSQNVRTNFIFIIFEKIMKVLDLKNTLEMTKTFKKSNFLLLSKNIKDLFFDNKCKNTDSIEESLNNILLNYNENTLLFVLNVKAILNEFIEGRKNRLDNSSDAMDSNLPTSFLTKYHLELFQQKITNNLQLLSLLDKIKNNLQNHENFTKKLFSSDITSFGPNLEGFTLDLLILKINKLINQISTDIISTLKNLPILSKLMMLKSQTISNSEFHVNLQYNKNLITIEKNLQNLKLNKKVINFFMLSMSKSIYLSQYDPTLLKLETLHQNKQITDIDYFKKHTELLNNLSIGFINQQKIQQIATVDFLTKFNIINSKIFKHFSNIIKSNLISHKVYLTVQQELILNKSKIIKLNKKIDILRKQEQNIMFQNLLPIETTSLVNKMEYEILEKQIENSIFLFSKLEKKLTSEKNFLVNIVGSSSEEFQISTILLEQKNFVQKLRNFIIQKKITRKLLNQKINIYNQFNYLQQVNLIKSDSFEKLNYYLQTQFSLLEKLVFLLSRASSKNNVSNLNKIIAKISNQIAHKLASVVSLWKITVLQKQKNLTTNDNNSLKQLIIQNIINFKVSFIQTLISKFLEFPISCSPSVKSFVRLIKNGLNQQIYLSKPLNQFNFIYQLYNVYIIDNLKNLNILTDHSFTLIFSEITEKLALKKLMQTNLVLTEFLRSDNHRKVIYLDKFIETVVISSSSKKIGIFKDEDESVLLKLISKSKNLFWKQSLLELTPIKIKTALEKLKAQNIFSFMPNSEINMELERLMNLFNQNKILHLSLNKQYINQKFHVIKNILYILCENLNTVTLQNIYTSIFEKNVWGINKLMSLDLLQQSKIKLLVNKLAKQKCQLISKLEKLSSSNYYSTDIDSVNSVDFKVLNQALQWITKYLENQFTYINSKVLIKVSEDSTIFLTGKFPEKENVFKNVKLYLLRYQFINQTFVTNLNLSRIYLLRKQKSILINRYQYQALKNSWKKFVSYKNLNLIETVLQNKYPILLYLNKELNAKFSFKLSQILEKNVFTKKEFYLLSNTLKRLTNSTLAVKDSSRWISSIKNLNLNKINQEVLTQKIILNYSVQNIPVYYRLLNDISMNFTTEKSDWFKILTNLKFQLNNNKLQYLHSQGWVDSNQTNLQLEVKSFINQTFDSISIIEKTWLNKGLVEEQLLDGNSSLKTLKSSFLIHFYKNFKQIIYSSKLNILKERQLINDEQFSEFKQNYENLFQLVRQAKNRVVLLDSRRKWKFINYRKYQTLSQGILKQLSLKITELLSKNKVTSKSFNSNIYDNENLKSLSSFSPKIYSIKTIDNAINSKIELSKDQNSATQIVKNFAQIQRQKNHRNNSVKSSNIGEQTFSMQALLQETLEQILDSSETNLIGVMQNFIEKSDYLSQNSRKIGTDLRNSELQNLVTLLNVEQIREFVRLTLQRLNSLEKQIKLKGPWLLQDEQNQKCKQIIFQNFVINIQKLNLIRTSYKSMDFEKGLLISSVSSSSVLDFNVKNKLNLILLNTDFPENNKDFLKELSNLENRLQKQYLKKFNTQLIDKELRLTTLTQNNLLDLSQYQKIVALDKILNASIGLQAEFNTITLEYQFILQNLRNEKIRQKFDLEVKPFLQVSKYQSTNLLLSQKLYNQIKTKIVKLLTDSFTVISPDFVNRNCFFTNSQNVEILSNFGIISENLSNLLVKKMNVQVQKQKLKMIINYLGKLQHQFSLVKPLVNKENKFPQLLQSIHFISVLSQLYELKQTKNINERQYLSVKQKLKQLKLLSLLNVKLIEFRQNQQITDTNVIEFRQQIIQKIQQKIKKAKTLSKFKFYLKSVSEYTGLTLKAKKVLNSMSQKQIESMVPNLQTSGRWAQVTLRQLAKQKLITSKQESRLSKVLTQQTNLKIEKLRRLFKTLIAFNQCIKTQNIEFNNQINEQQTFNILSQLLKSVNGSWKIVMLKQLRKQGLISQKILENLQQVQNNVNKNKKKASFLTTSKNSGNFSSRAILSTESNNVSLEIKLKQLLNIYYKQILKLNKLQINRAIRKTESDRKLKLLLSNVILLLENGGLKAFNVIYKIQWVRELFSFNLKNSVQKRGKRSNGVSPSISRDFVKKFETIKIQHLHNYQKLELKSKINLFNNYKSLIFKLWTDLDNKINDSILSVSRLINLKKYGLITSQQYSKLKVLLKTAIQRLMKLDQIFITQNLDQVTNASVVDPNSMSNMGTNSALNNSIFKDQLEQLQNQVYQSYLKCEYKQVEKNIIKQKFAQQQFNSYNLNQKATKLLKARLRKKQSIKKEQFAGYFQQFVNGLDSRYKAEGRNRRGPRINSIYRQLNQKLTFDPTLTKKFGVQLQTYLDKRFGPSLPIPPHLELKRWKIQNSQLIAKGSSKTTELTSRQGNQKYLILPVGIVRDMAPRRSVGLPILERLIVEYYSRN